MGNLLSNTDTEADSIDDSETVTGGIFNGGHVFEFHDKYFGTGNIIALIDKITMTI